MNLNLNEILVIDHIRMNPGITGKSLLNNTMISRRTLYATVRRLVERKEIIAKDSIKDARQRQFFLPK